MRKGKIGKRFLSIILACLMLTSMVPFAAFADEGSTNTVVSTFDDLKTAVANAKDGDTITLGANIEIPAGPEYNLVIDDAITIDGADYSITRAFDEVEGSDGYGNYEEVFYIQSAGVTIENLTIKGLDKCMKDEAGIYIAANGTEEKPIIIQKCVFDGAETSEANSGGTGIISQGGSAANVSVLNCQFSNQ